MGKMVSPPFLGCFDPILFIRAGKEDLHKILDKFEFRPDRTTDNGVSCPWASKKFPIDLQWEIGVSMLARSFLIKSSGKLLVTRTGIKAQSSSILGRIRPLILELLALERRKFHTFELEYLWSQFANLDQILCVALLGWGKGCVRFWGRLTLAHWTQVSDRCPLGYLFSVVFDWILLILSCNKNKHSSLDESEFPPDQTTEYGVSCRWTSKTSVSPLFLGWYWSNPF